MIRQFPSSVTTAVITIAVVAATYFVADTIVDGVTGKHIHQHIGDGLRKWLIPSSDGVNNESEQVVNLPSISGSKNQSAFGKVIPLILGEAYFTPYVLGLPYTTISGTDGVDQHYHCLYLIGYKDIEVKDVSMGLEVLSKNTANVRNGELAIDSEKYPRSINDTHLELQCGASSRADGEVGLYPQKVVQENFNTRLMNVNGTPENVYCFSAKYPMKTEVEFTFAGLLQYDNSGNKGYAEARVVVEHSFDGGKTWQDCCDKIDFSQQGGQCTVVQPIPAQTVTLTYDVVCKYERSPILYLWKTKINSITLTSSVVATSPIYLYYYNPVLGESQLKATIPAGSTSVSLSDIPLLTSSEAHTPYFFIVKDVGTEKVTTTVIELQGTFENLTFTYTGSASVDTIAENGYIKFKNNKAVTLRYVLREQFSAAQVETCYAGVVEYRLRRINAESTDSKCIDKVYLSAIRTWCYDSKATKEYNEEHPFAKTLIAQAPMNTKERDKTARLGFYIKVTEGVQDYFDKINLIATSIARTWDSENHGWTNELSATRNPAALALHTLIGDFRDEDYRYPITEGEDYISCDKIDLDSFGACYEECETEKDFDPLGDGHPDNAYYCDGVVVNRSKTIDLVNRILQTARSYLVIKGKKYGIFMDKVQQYPLLNLNNNNLLSLTYSKSFEELPDGQSVKYISALNYYQQDTMTIKPVGSGAVQASDKLESVEYPFITDPYHAKSMSLYQQACRKLRPDKLVAKVTGEGGLAEVGSLVTVQSDRILVGNGDGAEILELIESNGSITGIKTDNSFVVTDATKEYGVAINIVSDDGNGMGTEKILRKKVVISQAGEYSYFTFDEPISSSSTEKPEEGCVLSFGIYESEVIEELCVGKKENGDGTYELTLVPYAEEVYDADANMVPDFDPKVTPPQDSGVTINFGEKTVPATISEVIETIGIIKDDSTPEVPSNVLVTANKDFLQVDWTVERTDFVKYTTVEMSRDGGTTWSEVWSVGSNTFTYMFDRQTDGYPEKDSSDVHYLGNYKFRLKNMSIYGVESAYCTTTGVDLSTTTYGTWSPVANTFTQKNADQYGINFAWNPPTSGGTDELYGTNTYTITVKYDGTTRASVNTDLRNYTYTFNRSVDKYPEKPVTGLPANIPTLDNYSVSIQVTNESGKTSSVYTLSQIDYADYKTWIIPDISVNKEVVDRTAILTAIYDNEGIYGNQKILVKIKRDGNNYPVSTGSQTTFNQMLGITPDSSWYTPKFDAPVQPSSTSDTEGNYRENTSTDYETYGYKITQTLPLIGQTARMFKSGNVPIMSGNVSLFTKDVPEYSNLPSTLSADDVFHYIGGEISNGDVILASNYYYICNSIGAVTPVGTENPYEEGWFVVSGNNLVLSTDSTVQSGTTYYEVDFEQVYSKMLIVPTTYEYQIQMTNESGYLTNVCTETVEALCTSISDIVHSHEYYKNLYVEKLSAINANIGLISEGGMGSFADKLNYWALSNMTPEECGVAGGVMKGAFRVGGVDEYFQVTPIGNDEYKIELKAGNIELTSTAGGGEGLDFLKGTYIYSLDKKMRMTLSQKGIIIQKNTDTQHNPPNWNDASNIENLGQVTIDEKQNFILSNSDERIPFGQTVSGNVYHFETTATNDESGYNTQNIGVDGQIISTSTLSPILDPVDGSSKCFSGTVSKTISSWQGRVAYLSKASVVRFGSKGFNLQGEYIDVPDPLTGYSSAMREDSTVSGYTGTVGSYLGLNASQVEQGIFY